MFYSKTVCVCVSSCVSSLINEHWYKDKQEVAIITHTRYDRTETTPARVGLYVIRERKTGEWEEGITAITEMWKVLIFS